MKRSLISLRERNVALKYNNMHLLVIVPHIILYIYTYIYHILCYTILYMDLPKYPCLHRLLSIVQCVGPNFSMNVPLQRLAAYALRQLDE